jgi:ATP-dependent RNA helicase DHX29
MWVYLLEDVWESGVVNEKAIFLLCGEADFKMPAESVIIDRKIKASMNPKTLLTLKILRQRFQQVNLVPFFHQMILVK